MTMREKVEVEIEMWLRKPEPFRYITDLTAAILALLAEERRVSTATYEVGLKLQEELSTAQARVEKAEAESAVAKSFHDVAVKERDYERANAAAAEGKLHDALTREQEQREGCALLLSRLTAAEATRDAWKARAEQAEATRDALREALDAVMIELPSARLSDYAKGLLEAAALAGAAPSREEICHECGCPVRDVLDEHSCWCGVEIYAVEKGDQK